MIAIDTNLLVYAHRAAAPQHRAAQHALERAFAHPQGWGIALPCIGEFWSVVTHSTAAGGPSTPAQASAFIRSLCDDAGGQVWMPGPQLWKRLLQLAADLAVSGPRIFDLQIGLIAFENGAHEIWTHDRHFHAIPGLRVSHPIS